MNIEEFRAYCLSLPMVEESMPFDEVTLVMKVGGKIFALAGTVGFDHFAVKSDPEVSLVLRERYEAVQGAFHLNKKHWSDVYVDRDMGGELLRRQILDSYELVVAKSVTPKALRIEIQALYAAWRGA